MAVEYKGSQAFFISISAISHQATAIISSLALKNMAIYRGTRQLIHPICR
jgi:hypothetical protein